MSMRSSSHWIHYWWKAFSTFGLSLKMLRGKKRGNQLSEISTPGYYVSIERLCMQVVMGHAAGEEFIRRVNPPSKETKANLNFVQKSMPRKCAL